MIGDASALAITSIAQAAAPVQGRYAPRKGAVACGHP